MFFSVKKAKCSRDGSFLVRMYPKLWILQNTGNIRTKNICGEIYKNKEANIIERKIPLEFSKMERGRHPFCHPFCIPRDLYLLSTDSRYRSWDISVRKEVECILNITLPAKKAVSKCVSTSLFTRVIKFSVHFVLVSHLTFLPYLPFYHVYLFAYLICWVVLHLLLVLPLH